MKIYVGSDHKGFQLSGKLVDYLRKAGYNVVDGSGQKFDPEDDFPLFAKRIAHNLLSSEDKDPRGILLCGSGQGMCMAANRFKGIRAALGYDSEAARSARNDDDSNVLCLSALTLNPDDIYQIVETWLHTPFAGAARFKRRIQEMDQL